MLMIDRSLSVSLLVKLWHVANVCDVNVRLRVFSCGVTHMTYHLTHILILIHHTTSCDHMTLCLIHTLLCAWLYLAIAHLVAHTSRLSLLWLYRLRTGTTVLIIH